ncbi:MAG: acyl carrier protein [Methylocystis sp.]|uniref:acyl carrier protein n=1 Tax=Methylocystis sp. TaxID=1911079 RepID=UPI00393FFFE6
MVSNMHLSHDVLCKIVIETIVQYLGNEGADVHVESQLEAEYGLDSTELVCVAVDLERRLGLDLKQIRFGQLKTPNDIADAVGDLFGRRASFPTPALANA